MKSPKATGSLESYLPPQLERIREEVVPGTQRNKEGHLTGNWSLMVTYQGQSMENTYAGFPALWSSLVLSIDQSHK